MKEIQQMTEQELEEEIKEFIQHKFNNNKPYIFVSYSHKDKIKVMQKVLEWIRQGYNLIMDLDFENHGSDKDWTKLLCQNIRHDRCVQAVCFRSKHYYRSMACLIELLLLRSSFIRNKRNDKQSKKDIPMEIFKLSEKKEYDEDPEFDKQYETEYNNHKPQITKAERDMLKNGLETLCHKRLDAGKDNKTVQEYLDNLDETLEDGAIDYYNFIQSIFDDWFDCNDMNGNYKNYNFDACSIFDANGVYNFSTNAHQPKSGSKENCPNEDSKNLNEYKTKKEDVVTSEPISMPKGTILRYHVTENGADGYIEQRDSSTWVICKGSKCAPTPTRKFQNYYANNITLQQLFQNGKSNEDYECTLDDAYRFLVGDVVVAEKAIQSIKPERINKCDSQNTPAAECIPSITSSLKPIHKAELEDIKLRVSMKKKYTKKELSVTYTSLKGKLGRIPTLLDCYKECALFPEQIFTHANNYQLFLQEVDKDYQIKYAEEQYLILTFITSLLANGKRIHELLILKMLLEGNEITWESFKEKLKIYETHAEWCRENDYKSAVRLLHKDFLTGGDVLRYQNIELLLEDNSKLTISDQFTTCLKNVDYKKSLSDLIAYSIQLYVDRYMKHDEYLLTRYMTYSRKDVCRILNWDKNEESVIYGYKIKHNTCPMFVTLQKKDVVKSQNYADMFVDSEEFSWMTRNGVTLNHDEVITIRNCKENGLKLFLFVKQNKEDKEFFYIGSVIPKNMRPDEIDTDKGKKPIVRIDYTLNQPLNDTFYEYIDH